MKVMSQDLIDELPVGTVILRIHVLLAPIAFASAGTAKQPPYITVRLGLAKNITIGYPGYFKAEQYSEIQLDHSQYPPPAVGYESFFGTTQHVWGQKDDYYLTSGGEEDEELTSKAMQVVYYKHKKRSTKFGVVKKSPVEGEEKGVPSTVHPFGGTPFQQVSTSGDEVIQRF